MSRRRQLERSARIAITEVDHAGCGRGQHDGFDVRVWGGLPGETVGVRVLKRQRSRLETLAETVSCVHADRVAPECPMAGRCGGCALQHLSSSAQRDRKRSRLAMLLDAAGAGGPETWLPDLHGPTLGYRRKARLGVRYVPGKGGVLVGFRERGSSRVADVQACRILDARIGQHLPALRRMIAALSCPEAVPQLEIAVGDDAAAIILRHLEPLTGADEAHLGAVAAMHGWQMFLQPGGPGTVHRIDRPVIDDGSEPPSDRLHYALPAFGLRLAFHPLDFTQVNADVNRAMVARAVELLAPTAEDSVLDLFCGLGNFTLPLATRSREVHGVEGSETLVARALENAAANSIGNASFSARDLYSDEFDPASLPVADLWLLDPPRSGAEQICSGMGAAAPRRIVYVSCNPETLARDAELLVRSGYRMTHAGIVDMFPHTAHVESMAVFDSSAGG